MTVTYTDGKAETLPAVRDDEDGRRLTGKRAFDLMARDDVLSVTVEPTTRYAGGSKGRAR